MSPGESVALAVWEWLQNKKAQKYVPWVLDPKSKDYDPIKAAKQETQDELLGELESVILETSKQ